MRKILLAAALAITSFCANAQFYAGGTAGIAVDAMGNSASTSIVVCPEGGYKFNDTWAAGGSINLGYTYAGGSAGIVGLTPYARATFANIESVNFFAEAALPINGIFANGASAGSIAIALRPGFTVDLTENLQMLARTTLLHCGVSGGAAQVGFAIANEFTMGVIYNF